VIACAGLRNVPPARGHGCAGRNSRASMRMRIKCQKAWSGSEKAPNADSARAPSVIGLRASSQPTCSGATYTVGGSVMLRFSECCTGKRSSVPESFRGGCSFGGQHAGSLPLAVVGNLRRFEAEL
jgi:hypothetical protein